MYRFNLIVATLVLLVRIGAQTTARGPSQQYEAAVAYYSRIVASAPAGRALNAAQVQARTELATAYFMLHRYKESLEASQPLVNPSSTPPPAKMWTVRGLDCLELNQVHEAIESFQQALRLDPNAGTARLGLGDAFVRTGETRRAADEFESQAQRTPTVPEAWYKLGLVHAKLARELPRSAPPEFAKSVMGQQLLAEQQLARGNNLEAARALLRLSQQASEEYNVHAELGLALLDLGHFKLAEEEFQRELSHNPNSSQAQLGLAEIEVLHGNWPIAISSMQRLAAEQPYDLSELVDYPPTGPLRQRAAEGTLQIPQDVLNTQAGNIWKAWLENTGTASQLLDSERPAAVACPDLSTVSLLELGRSLTESCSRALMSRLVAKGNRLTPEQRLKLIETEFHLGDHSVALQDVQAFVDANPKSERGLYWLSRAHAAFSEDCFLKVAALDPESVRVHQMLAERYSDSSDFAKATAEYQAAIRLDPELPDLHLGLGTVFWKAGHLEQAEAELEKTLQVVPDSAAAHYELGDVLVQQRQWTRAINQLSQVSANSSFTVEATVDLAKAEDESGSTKRALDDLLKVANSDEDGQIHFLLASLYRKVGDTRHGQEALSEFKRMRADSPEGSQNDFDAILNDYGKKAKGTKNVSQ